MFPMKKKRVAVGGPDEYEEVEPEESMETEPSEGMGMDAKDEAVSTLCKALGVSPAAKARVKSALEAFVYACKEE